MITSDGATPAVTWLRGIDDAAASEVMAVLSAVRDAPPFRFAGGGKWQAMREDLHGVYEVRCRRGRDLHRLFCVLDRSTPGGPVIVLLDGASKRADQRFDRAIYRRVAALRDEYARLRRLAFTPPSAWPRR